MAPDASNKFCKRQDLGNEGTVKEFFVSRLLKDLGYADGEIKPNTALQELLIGRGRNQELHRPDYLCHSGTTPKLVVEAKATDEIIDEYLYQGQGYAFEINKDYEGDEKPVRYVLLTNGEKTKLYHWHDRKTVLLSLDFEDFKDGNDKFDALRSYIGRSQIDKPRRKDASDTFSFSEPENIQEIKNLFVRCHKVIRNSEGYGDSAAFYEFIKLLFVKLDQDRLLGKKDEEVRRRLVTGEPLPTEMVTFRVGWIEDREAEGVENPVDEILFGKLKRHLQEQIDVHKKKRIFAADEHLNLEPPTIKRVVRILEHYNLIETNEELNGRLFETFLNASMRGRELGQFFTPRSVVKFMVGMADIRVGKDHIDRVVDACCGTAGFLVEAMDDMAKKAVHNASLSNIEKERIIDRIRNEYLWGIDFGKEPPIARIARINMYLHEDGGSKIFFADALDKDTKVEKGIDKELKRDRDELRDELVEKKTKFDCILSNPPFAKTLSKEDENERRILSQYDLGYTDPRERKHLRSSLRSSVMFLERYRDLLKPHGKLLIIMEETPLESDKGVNPDVRKFLRDNFVVKAVISLPRNTFVPAESTAKTSILYLVKKEVADEEQIVPFTAESKNVGHDDAGKPTPETCDLFTKEDASQIEGGLIDVFRKWEQGKAKPPVVVGMKDRLDVKNLIPRRRNMLSEWRSKGYDVKTLEEVLQPISERVRPKREPSVLFKIPSVHFDGSMTVGEERLGRDFKYSSVKRIHEGDIIASRIDIVSGATGLVSKEFEGAVVSQEFLVFKPKVANSYYLWQILRSEYVRDALFGYSTGITGRHRVEWDDVNDIEVPVPNKAKQEEIQRLVQEFKAALTKATDRQNEIEFTIKAIIG